jgi:hypothetical protein
MSADRDCGQNTDEPVAGDGHGDANRDPPHQPWQAADCKEQRCPWQLLRHEGAIDEPVEAIFSGTPLENELGRMLEFKIAMQLPEAMTVSTGGRVEPVTYDPIRRLLWPVGAQARFSSGLRRYNQ